MYLVIGKKWFLKVVLLFMIFVLLDGCAPSSEYLLKKSRKMGNDTDYVKVLVQKTDRRITITSRSRVKISSLNNNSIKYNGKGKKFIFIPEKIKEPVLIESWGSFLQIDDKEYRGMIELHNVMGKLCVINVVRMYEYLYGVLPSEIMTGWPVETLKAQAVAARTYAYHHILKNKNNLYDLDATTKFQVYKGRSVEDPKTNSAVDDTCGEIAVYKNKPIVAFFHSTCGGYTVDDNLVWNGDDMEYLRSVRCPYCKGSPSYAWKEILTRYEMIESLKKKYSGVGQITGISFRRKDRRVVNVVVKHTNGIIRISGNNFRLLFPAKKIKSLYFHARKKPDGLELHGHGWGHGVGLCQWGARGMADHGKNYENILKFYYRGIKIININKIKTNGARRKYHSAAAVNFPNS